MNWSPKPQNQQLLIMEMQEKVGKASLVRIKKQRKQLGVVKEDVVKRKRQLEDYDLGTTASNPIAIYDPEVVREFLNDRDYTKGFKHLLLKRSAKGLQNTLFYNTAVILILYSVFWFVVHYFYVQYVQRCTASTSNSAINTATPTQQADSFVEGKRCAVVNYIDENFDKFITSANNTHKNLLKLMMFLLGFYVKRMMARWWDQVSKIPTMEPICLAMNGMGTAIEEKGGDEGLNNFKIKIARYVLLSWTMCLCGISRPLNSKYKEKDAWIEKGLITRKEWEALTTIGGSRDGWKDKWWIPLNWATKLINEDEKIGKKQFADHKYIMSEISKFGDGLQHISLYSENPMPKIQKQAITIAGWFLLLVGVFAGQGKSFADNSNNEHSVFHGFIKFFINLPYMNFLIYILIFAWIKVGEKLSNPFGSDYQVDVDTVSRLDYEVWVASHLIQKNSLLPDQNIGLLI